MDNVLIIDKPAGMTSHDVVDAVRRKLKVKRVGHCGTLDPMATGVLVLVMNKATKLSAELSADDKEYLCSISIGITTDTHDATGKLISQKGVDALDTKTIRDAILSFRGKLKQVPPMLSAKHHKGERLYNLARKGITVKRDPVDVEIKDIEVLNIKDNEAAFRLVCSKGTYVRTLCHDIGERLGCGAHMKSLRRIRSGSFHIKDAVSLGEFL